MPLQPNWLHFFVSPRTSFPAPCAGFQSGARLATTTGANLAVTALFSGRLGQRFAKNTCDSLLRGSDGFKAAFICPDSATYSGSNLADISETARGEFSCWCRQGAPRLRRRRGGCRKEATRLALTMPRSRRRSVTRDHGQSAAQNDKTFRDISPVNSRPRRVSVLRATCQSLASSESAVRRKCRGSFSRYDDKLVDLDDASETRRKQGEPLLS